MIFKKISGAIFRTIQIAVLAFFAFWLYEKLFVGGADFAVLTLVFLPFLLVGVGVGAIISGVFYLRGSKQKSVRILNLILFLCYVAVVVYFIVLIF